MNGKWKQTSELTERLSKHSSSTWEKEFGDFSAIVVVGTFDRGHQRGRSHFIWSSLYHKNEKIIITQDARVKQHTAIRLAMKKMELIDEKINDLQN